jgi:hypothetical protein
MQTFAIPTRTKKVPSPTMTRTNNTKTASTIHRDERVPINRATKLLSEGRTITKLMTMDMVLPCRIPLIFIRRIIGNMLIQVKKYKTFKSKNKTQAQIRLLKHIKLIVQWLPTMKCTQITNTSLSKTKASIDSLPLAMPRLRAAVALFSHIALCSMLLERTQIFKQRWLSQAITILEISIRKQDIREEDQQMLTSVKEKTSNTMNKI